MSYYISSPDSSTAGSFYDSSVSFPQRPASASPPLSQTYPGLAKMRYEACRGFEIEDDLEFCPALAVVSPMVPAAVPSSAIASNSASSYARYSHANDGVPTVEVRRARNALEIIDPATGLPIGRR